MPNDARPQQPADPDGELAELRGKVHDYERWIAQPRFWRNQLHPDDLDRVTRAFARGAESGERFEIEYRMFAADGRTAWVRDEVRVDAGADGLRMRGLMSDITENRITEQALAQSRELLASGRDER